MYTYPKKYKNVNYSLKHGLSTGEEYVVCGSEIFDENNKCFDLVGWDFLYVNPENGENDTTKDEKKMEIDEKDIWVFPTGHLGPISSVCFKPRALEFATASFDGSIKFWKNQASNDS